MENQKAVRKELEKLVEQYKLADKFTTDDVLGWINDENESDAMKANREYQDKWMKYFTKVESINELNRVLQIFTNAWNYFPHKSLGGKSPVQMAKFR